VIPESLYSYLLDEIQLILTAKFFVQMQSITSHHFKESENTYSLI